MKDKVCAKCRLAGLLAAAVLLLSALFPLAACSGGEGGDTLSLERETTAERLISGWNSEEDFGYFGASEAFGITRLNTDSAYVKEGEGSMYVRVDGNYKIYNFPGKYNDKRPFIRYFMADIEHDTDFSKAESFRMDIYNASDRDGAIGLRFSTTTERGDYGAALAVVTDMISLPKGQWTRAEFKLDRDRYAHLGMGDVNKIDIYFDNREEDQTPLQLYLDNFCVLETEDAMSAAPAPEMSGDVITDYSDEWFTDSAFPYEAVQYPSLNSFYQPRMSRNTDPAYIKTGTASLRIERVPVLYQDSVLRASSEVGLFGVDYLKKIDFTAYDPTKTDIVLDVYNDYDEPIDFKIAVATANIQVEKTFILEPNSWNELRFPMDTTDANNMGIDYADVIKLNARFYEHYGPTAVHYVDNIRFEARA